jgi:hypothetical protein
LYLGWYYVYNVLKNNNNKKNTLLYNLHPAATRLTIMDVEVDELCTITVAKIPIIKPTTGLDINGFPNISPKT